MTTDNSSYPSATATSTPTPAYTLPLPSGENSVDPSKRTQAAQTMEAAWGPVDLCVGGTTALRQNARDYIPQEPREDDAAYNRRIFHAVLPPFLNRLVSQAAGVILRKGINIDGDPYWSDWAKNVTGDGTTLNEYARRILITAFLYGHHSTIVDFPSDAPAASLADERAQARRPYVVPVHPRQILGWRTLTNSPTGELAQVRIHELITEPDGDFGEEILSQIRVLTPGGYQLWRPSTPTNALLSGTNLPGPSSWEPYGAPGTTTLDRIPLVTVYSNRIGNLLSAPPLLEVAHLVIAYAQRFTDYHHSIHVGASPILTLRGFDADSNDSVGLSVNNALCLPPDGGAEYVEPTSDAFDAQLKCLAALEDQISRLGINTLTQQNLTNAAAEAKRMDRIDSDSIMAVIAGDLERAITEIFDIAATYTGIPAPVISIPRDYEYRLLDGNQITAYLQLYMQRAISQRTLLTILQQGEILPATLDVDSEISATQEMLEEQLAMERLLGSDTSSGPDQAFQSTDTTTTTTPQTNAGQGTSLTSQTLPTPMRSGRNE